VPPATGSPNVSTKSEKEFSVTGVIPGPLLALPITTGPTSAAVPGSCELSISSTKTPGEMNLNFLEESIAIYLLSPRLEVWYIVTQIRNLRYY
jgi:hypothetical protein